MTENELNNYLAKKTAYKLAIDELHEFCPTYYAANISSITGLPIYHDRSTPDKVSNRIDEHEHYIKLWKKAFYEMRVEREKLSKIMMALKDENAKKYLYLRYIRGFSCGKIGKILGRKKTALFNYRKIILEIAKDL